ncbi:hypothetical protein PR048_031332 [Dryococelus australis]|uniref:Uncharacterized protein n=1 Tax=Dryococelus australis TaxID=614101 RepID=A0ABQ9G4Y2_9NEOP|nr:hypothetical protein PR048_031332 [Dryococelus australis]
MLNREDAKEHHLNRHDESVGGFHVDIDNHPPVFGSSIHSSEARAHVTNGRTGRMARTPVENTGNESEDPVDDRDVDPTYDPNEGHCDVEIRSSCLRCYSHFINVGPFTTLCEYEKGRNVSTVTDKKDECGTVGTEERGGRQESLHEQDQARRETILKHISRFSRMESHCYRKTSTREKGDADKKQRCREAKDYPGPKNVCATYYVSSYCNSKNIDIIPLHFDNSAFYGHKTLAHHPHILSARIDDKGYPVDWTTVCQVVVQKSYGSKVFFADCHLTNDRLDSAAVCTNMPMLSVHWLSVVTVAGDDWASVLQEGQSEDGLRVVETAGWTSTYAAHRVYSAACMLRSGKAAKWQDLLSEERARMRVLKSLCGSCGLVWFSLGAGERGSVLRAVSEMAGRQGRSYRPSRVPLATTSEYKMMRIFVTNQCATMEVSLEDSMQACMTACMDGSIEDLFFPNQPIEGRVLIASRGEPITPKKEGGNCMQRRHISRQRGLDTHGLRRGRAKTDIDVIKTPPDEKKFKTCACFSENATGNSRREGAGLVSAGALEFELSIFMSRRTSAIILTTACVEDLVDCLPFLWPFPAKIAASSYSSVLALASRVNNRLRRSESGDRTHISISRAAARHPDRRQLPRLCVLISIYTAGGCPLEISRRTRPIMSRLAPARDDGATGLQIILRLHLPASLRNGASLVWGTCWKYEGRGDYLLSTPPTSSFNDFLPARIPPRRSGFNPRIPGSLRIFASGNRVGRCRRSTGFLGDLSFPPHFRSGAALYSPQAPSSALKTSLLRAAKISPTPWVCGSATLARGMDGGLQSRLLYLAFFPLPHTFPASHLLERASLQAGWNAVQAVFGRATRSFPPQLPGHSSRRKARGLAQPSPHLPGSRS